MEGKIRHRVKKEGNMMGGYLRVKIRRCSSKDVKAGRKKDIVYSSGIVKGCVSDVCGSNTTGERKKDEG